MRILEPMMYVLYHQDTVTSDFPPTSPHHQDTLFNLPTYTWNKEG